MTREPAYYDIAMATGGQVLAGLTVDDAPKIATLNHAPAEPAPYAATVILPVTASVSSLVLTVDGGRAVTVTRPDGTVVSGSDANAQLLTLSRGVIVVLTAPAVGSWTVSITDCDACSVSMSGQASALFDSWFVNDKREGAPIEDPFAGCPYWAVAGVVGPEQGIYVDFRRPSGAGIRTFPLTPAPPNPGSRFYYGEVIIPNEPYQIYLRAEDGTLRIVMGVRTPRAGPCPGGVTPSGTLSAIPSATSSSTSSPAVDSSTPVPSANSSAVPSPIVSVPLPPVNGTTLDGASAGATTSSPSSMASASDSTASLINAVVRPTPTIVETKYIFAQCGGKSPCATTRTWDPCPDPPCLATPAPAVPCGKPACAGAVAHCGKPGCAGGAQQHYAPDTITTVVVEWTTTCPSVETYVSVTLTSYHTRVSTITKYLTVQSVVPCATCTGPNYPVGGPGGPTPGHVVATQSVQSPCDLLPTCMRCRLPWASPFAEDRTGRRV
ncbi:hypothetical protein QBC34DRAFT_479221 [Podospora aff. communis PSN243]|uniref:Uncharacterized protein n=1 Tax=Podospora aff. communis PSN243 TaxID=3040156 RepID=A0AAV9G649_9PEZI|nr:hypothetical protein QBC34DRAFT_479221 [Podospora aff. communis PSN243]